MNTSTEEEKAHPEIDRSSARLVAIQALYEIDMTGVDASPVLDEFLRQRWKSALAMATEGEKKLPEMAPPDGALLAELVRGVVEKCAELDGIIGPSLSEEWTIERLEVILRAILRAGTLELLTMGKIPARVIINEYVNVAKAFFDDNKPSLVNGVLDKIARTLRAAEF
jgi:N utilization substance protein B